MLVLLMEENMEIPKLRFLLVGLAAAFLVLLFALSVGALYMELAFKFGGGR